MANSLKKINMIYKYYLESGYVISYHVQNMFLRINVTSRPFVIKMTSFHYIL